MKPEEEEIIARINQAMQKMKEEINKVKYSGEEMGVSLTFGSSHPKIVFFNPPVQQVLVEFKERKRTISGPKTRRS